jgi:hypothetical protein
MSQLSPILRRLSDGEMAFWCPGCDGCHAIKVTDGGWTWDGNAERPTFSPSVLIRSGHYVDGKHPCWCDYNREHPGEIKFGCGVCHSFVRDGQIQFLGDCTHALAGRTVPLAPWPTKRGGKGE